MQSVYFTDPTDVAVFVFVFLSILPDNHVWKMIGWVLWHINLRMLFNAKFCLYTYETKNFLTNTLVGNILNEPDLISLPTIKWFQVLLYNTKNSI